jgi:hypothetical protein
VEADQFVLVTPWNPPESDPKARRGDAEVLGAEELRVAAGFDVFAFKPEGGGGPGAQQQKLQPQPWAVVTAVVPLARQKQEFARAFAGAEGADPKKDVPRYFMPILERTEVSEAAGAKENWQVIPPPTKLEDQWAGNAKDFVSPKYTDPELTGHLANLFYNEWGEKVSHPRIPRAGEEPKPAAEAAVAPVAAPADAKPPEAKPGEPTFRRQTAEPAPPPPAPGVDKGPVEAEVEFLLLRVFDYTVEPGKKYRYRVTLGMQNPNHGRSLLYLKTPESATKEVIASEPSPPTGTVTIPDGHRILAGAVDAGTRYTEPTATVLVTAIDPQEGVQAAFELKGARRGSVANKKQATVPVKHPQTKQEKKVTLDFESNILVLDIDGGRTLYKRKAPTSSEQGAVRPAGGGRGAAAMPPITTPGEVLLLDAEGNMMVRSELEDEKLYEESVVREEPAAPEGKPLLDGDRRDRKEAAAKAKGKGKALLNSDR